MAQKPGAKRLLIKPAKATSAGVFLALVLAALMLLGCGGGSSDSSSSGSTAADAAGGSGDPGSTTGTGGASSDANGTTSGANGAEKAAGSGRLSGGGSSANGDQPSAGSKHGPRIAQPKGEPEPGITPQQRQEATVASMALESPSSQASSAGPQALPATYTCDGKGTSPALRWQGVPQGTAELVIFTMNVQPVEEKLFFDWAVAGLSPDLTEVEVGKLPRGAIVGRNSFGKAGYEICPPSGAETYVFTVFALPRKLSPSQGFDPSALRKEVLDSSGNVGLLALSYARG
ncbi:MAG TPA: YbhB/YbcL family Raf kinase inhibitor-like protein [Solirubrobacterales bacterium]|nr:YbhB/YbcL family Raf kinase inhibitor-like protein [Solirubrobacterales bacterium]